MSELETLGPDPDLNKGEFKKGQPVMKQTKIQSKAHHDAELIDRLIREKQELDNSLGDAMVDIEALEAQKQELKERLSGEIKRREASCRRNDILKARILELEQLKELEP